ncbi:MAG: hypothetical protein ACRD3E_01125 [Terriglobales bacterium]
MDKVLPRPLSQGEQLEILLRDFKACDSRESVPVTTFSEAERSAIIDALQASSRQVAGKGGAAERLGLKRTTLQPPLRQNFPSGSSLDRLPRH